MKKIEKADTESIFQSIVNRETANGMPKDIAENLKINFRENKNYKFKFLLQ